MSDLPTAETYQIQRMASAIQALCESMVDLCRRLDVPLPDPLQQFRAGQQLEENMNRIVVADEDSK